MLDGKDIAAGGTGGLADIISNLKTSVNKPTETENRSVVATGGVEGC